jgi:hypothetical protein
MEKSVLTVRGSAINELVKKEKRGDTGDLSEVHSEYEMADEIINSLVEMWNDNNPLHKLNGDLLPIIKNHIRYSYVAGWEAMRKEMKDILRNIKSYKNHTISRYYLMAKLEFLEKKS